MSDDHILLLRLCRICLRLCRVTFRVGGNIRVIRLSNIGRIFGLFCLLGFSCSFFRTAACYTGAYRCHTEQYSDDFLHFSLLAKSTFPRVSLFPFFAQLVSHIRLHLSTWERASLRAHRQSPEKQDYFTISTS